MIGEILIVLGLALVIVINFFQCVFLLFAFDWFGWSWSGYDEFDSDHNKYI